MLCSMYRLPYRCYFIWNAGVYRVELTGVCRCRQDIWWKTGKKARVTGVGTQLPPALGNGANTFRAGKLTKKVSLKVLVGFENIVAAILSLLVLLLQNSPGWMNEELRSKSVCLCTWQVELGCVFESSQGSVCWNIVWSTSSASLLNDMKKLFIIPKFLAIESSRQV